jgi:hypothetical protein
VDACSKLACKASVLDGEVVVQDEQGLSNFQALQSAIHSAAPDHFLRLRSPAPQWPGSAVDSAHGEAGGAAEADATHARSSSSATHVDCDGAKFFKAAAEFGLEDNSRSG